MSIISQDQKRLDNIANMYHKTGGEMREMWKKKWYALIKQIYGRINEVERSTTDTREIY